MTDPSNPLPEPSDEEIYRLAPPPPVEDRYDYGHDEPDASDFSPDVEVDPISDDADDALQPFQFTLRDMIFLMIGVAVWLGVIGLLGWSWPVAAGLSGVAAFVAFALLIANEPESPRARFIGWCILGVYLLTSLVALVLH